MKTVPSKSAPVDRYIICFGVKYRFIELGYNYQLAQTIYRDIKEREEEKVDALAFCRSLIPDHSYVGDRGVGLAIPTHTLPFGCQTLNIKSAFQFTDDVTDPVREGVRYIHTESCRAGIHKLNRELKYIGYPTITPSFPFEFVIGDTIISSPSFDILPLKYVDEAMVDVSIVIKIPESYEGNVEIEYPIYLFMMKEELYKTPPPSMWSCEINEDISAMIHCDTDGCGWYRYENYKSEEELA